MKLLKFALFFSIAAIALFTGNIARATFVLDGTYTFTATDGHNSLDGSWITFSNDTLVNWSFNDIHANDTSPYPPNNLPLTPANSQMDPNYIYGGVFGVDTWAFRIVGTADPSTYYYDYFQLSNNLEGPGAGGALGRLYDGFGDPQGNWVYQVSGTPQGTPDAGSTLPLIGGVLIALGVGRRFLLGRAA